MIKLVLIIIAVLALGKIGLYFLVNRMLFHPDSSIESTPDEFGLEYENVYFNSSNGSQLNGLFFPAKDAKVTLILFHGNAENIGDRLDYVKMLHDLTLNIFYFDYQGYGRSDGNPLENRTYEDGLAAYNYVKNRNDVDPNSIAFLGRSLGGAIAIDLATKVKCYRLITDGAFSSIRNIGKTILPFIPMYLVIPDKYNNVAKISNVRTPILIIHGTEDETVPFSHSKTLYEAANTPKEFYQINKAGHNDTHLIAGQPYFDKIKTFLEL
ncbi:MAG: alpha/beta hydrolase [Candidatus Anammoxibacter sp.]